MLEKIFREFVEYAESAGLPIEAVAFGDERKILLEHHFVKDRPRNIFSNTKSFMSTAAGMAISEGKLSLEDRLTDYFPEAVPEDAEEKIFQVKLKHLLTMSSGFGRPYLMSADRRAGVGMPDYVVYMLSRPMPDMPGERFAYSTADSILAGRMIEKAVGRNLAQYLYEKLLSPMGIGYPIWECCPMGHPCGGGGMFLTLANMMKLGQLYLADGIWEGERLVDSGWITQATSKQIENAAPDNVDTTGWSDSGYGYQFWLSPYPGSYRGDGAFGQITTVLPGSGLVVAVQCPDPCDFELTKRALHERVLTQV